MVLLAAVLAAAMAFPLLAQDQRMTFGGGPDARDERVSTWIMYYDADSQRSTGGLALNYNTVQWREDYARRLETILQGKIWRLGKHFWSNFDTNLPVEMGGVAVDPGYYYLGLQRSQDGSRWSLALIGSDGARKARLDAVNVSEAEVTYSVPLGFERVDEKIDHLSIYFEVPGSENGIAQGSETELSLKIAFGPFRMTAPIRAAH